MNLYENITELRKDNMYFQQLDVNIEIMTNNLT